MIPQSAPPDFNLPSFKANNFVCAERAPIAHGFFTRQGGVSEGLYASLNCGVGSGDDPAKVMENRARVAGALAGRASHLLGTYQVHGDECVKVSSLWTMEQRPQADAMVTDVLGIALGVLTADCAPVLFWGQKRDGASVIGAAHAGWQGAVKGVLASTVRGMLELGAVQGSIKAAIGPCIAQKSYEVTEAFCHSVLVQDQENEKFFQSGARRGHVHFDLAGYCALRLYKAGVEDVYISALDTYAREDLFFSYRRSVHAEQTEYGRQISAILIQP